LRKEVLAQLLAGEQEVEASPGDGLVRGASLHEAAAVEHEDASAWRIEAVGDQDPGPPGYGRGQESSAATKFSAQQVCHGSGSNGVDAAHHRQISVR
jgi:hypothetical protein